MATKKTNIEELEQQYLESEKTTKLLLEQFLQAKRAEEKQKKAKLEAEKESRYKEVINAYENFEELKSKFIEDYGEFEFETDKYDDVFDFFWKRAGWI